MLRMESESGWWLITHPDHARLAAAFAAHWGNHDFQSPLPRAEVLTAIRTHDDGWATRDACPQITGQGKPSAFSIELVGKYSAFEEIDLADYLAVRDRAVRLVAAENPYAALLVSMHTYNLLTARADRSTIAPAQLPLLDAFLSRQLELQQQLRNAITTDPHFTPEETASTRIENHFRLLQATDNLSLLACVNYTQPATLLHPLPLHNGSASEIDVVPLGERNFRLTPWPLAVDSLTVEFRTRHVTGKIFAKAEDLQSLVAAAERTNLSVTLSA